MLRTLAILLAALSLGAGTAFAQTPPAGMQMPGGGTVDAQPAGTVPWQVLQQAKTVQKLDKQDVKLYGFMMPLEQTRLQKRFLLASFPPHCPFCMPGGPESMVEVVADQAVEFTYEPIIVAGRMAILEDDVVYYRLTNANAVSK
jgi:uncharacterized protein